MTGPAAKRQPQRTAWLPRRWLVAAATNAIVLAALAVACGGGEDPAPTAKAGPPTAKATSDAPTQPVASPTITALPTSTATASPSSTPVSPGPCPLSADACEFAEQVVAWALDGDIDALVALAEFSEYVCRDAELPVDRGPFPLCEGVEGGATLDGFVWLPLNSEGMIVSPSALPGLLREHLWIPRSRKQVTTTEDRSSPP